MSLLLTSWNMTRTDIKGDKILSTKRIRAALSDVSDFNSMENSNSASSIPCDSAVKSLGGVTKCPRPKLGKKAAYKHVPHSEKPAHLVARRNERERKRVQAVNSAFLQLRKHVPHEPRHKRLSKFKTLKVAIQYIRHLQDLIQSHDHKMAAKHKHANLSLHKPSRTFHAKYNKTTLPPYSLASGDTTPVNIRHDLDLQSHDLASKLNSDGYSMNANLHHPTSRDPGCHGSTSKNTFLHQDDYNPSQLGAQTGAWSPMSAVHFNNNHSLTQPQPPSALSISDSNNGYYQDVPRSLRHPTNQWTQSLDADREYQSASFLSVTRSLSATPDSMTSSLDSWNNSTGILGSFKYAASFQENTGGLSNNSHSPCGSFLT